MLVCPRWMCLTRARVERYSTVCMYSNYVAVGKPLGVTHFVNLLNALAQQLVV
jgi:hypothetical protein